MIGWWVLRLTHDLLQVMLISVRASLVFATQTWLAETPEQATKAGTPSYLSIGMSGQFWTWGLSDLRG